MVDKVRVGFVGCGFMGQGVHLPCFLKAEGCEILAIAEVRERLGRAVAERYRIPKYYRSHEEMAEDGDIDACVVIVGDDLHAPICIDLLKAGKHVFTEKPMATSFNDAKAMVEEAERSRVKLMVGYMKRYDSGCEKAKEIMDGLMDTRELGDITFVRVHDFGGDWICGYPPPPIMTDEPHPPIKSRVPTWIPEKDRGRWLGFLNFYCHDINLLRWFVGDPVGIISSTWGSRSKISLIEYEEFQVSFEAGGISASFFDEEIKFYFSDGWLKVKIPPPLLRNVPAGVELYKAGKIQRFEVPLAKWSWSFENQAQHFIDCIIGNREPRSSGSDSAKDVLIAEAIYRCYAEGRSQKLEF